MTKEVMQQALEALENHEGNYKLGRAGCERQEAVITAIKEVLAQQPRPEQQQARVDVITVTLMREGINKHRARELADHFVNFTLPPPLPVQEPVGKVVEISSDGFQCEFNQRLAVGTKLYIAPPLPVQEPKKRCCDHDSDCAIHNGDALPVGPCDCSQTFISSPHLGIVVTVSYQLAVLELAKLVENNFGQMPRNDEWADKVLLVRDTFEAARNKGAKP